MRTHRSLVTSWLRHLAALVALLGCSGFVVICVRPLYFRDGARAGFEYTLLVSGDRKSPRDYFFRLQGQREGGTTVAIAPFFIYPGPFSFEGLGGISDPALVGQSSDTVACFELFENGFFGDLAHTVDFCGRYSQGGYQVFNSENQDQRFYPGVYVLEFLIVYDGSELSYSTRPPGAPSWDLVTSVPFGFTNPLIPSMGGVGFHRRGVYDLLELSWTATMPLDTTPEQGCGWHVQEAYRFDLSALEKLEGAAPDFAGATADLGLARSELGLALDLAPDFLDAKIGKQTVRYLTSADRRLEKAEEKASRQDANGAVAQLLKSFRDQGAAIQVIFVLDFRDQF